MKVSVVDKNDTPPSWDGHPSVFTVSEDLVPGHPIATVKAVDADTVGQVTYELVSPPVASVAGNDDSQKKKATEEVFAVDPSRGVISLLRPLDREAEDEYLLIVRANDGVQHSDFDITVKASIWLFIFVRFFLFFVRTSLRSRPTYSKRRGRGRGTYY